MALYFGGKDHVGTHHLFPLRGLPNMSSSVKKYIGLDVHKEAIATETKSMCTYSSRRMLVGSTLAARIAGMTAANVVTKRISARTLP
jgi:hypothetical protein